MTIEQRTAASDELQEWLSKQYTRHLELKASSWFVLSATGDQVGRFPEGRLDLEDFRNFAHKSYFHGGEEEFAEGTSQAPTSRPAVDRILEQFRPVSKVRVFGAGAPT
ncbi:MAG: hypothetical protein R3B90_11995 [Planctomycetaceae bacterium]